MKWWTTLERQTRTFRLACLTWWRRSKGERQDSGGASAQRCEGHQHQRLHQDQDRLWAQLCLPPDGLGNVDHHKLDRQWCVRFCLGSRCLPLFAPVWLATSRSSFLWPTCWQDQFHLPRLQGQAVNGKQNIYCCINSFQPRCWPTPVCRASMG